ncbi:MAG: PP2C family serine/threonine-protein phosphatase [Oscillospiraceae bacterium]|nr:PP2C family serine/threonine-protein phosphatase [Oscillospiraceae bacterium]
MEKNNDKLSGEGIIDVEAEELVTVTETELEKYLNPEEEITNITDKTASLWKYNGVPENEPEPHEEYTASEYEFDGIRITGARVRGKKHKHDGTNCDDWFEFGSVGEWTVLAVSDGAGSKKYSRIGAKESCRAAVAGLREYLSVTDEDMKEKLSLPLDNQGFMEGCSHYASVLQDVIIKANAAVAEAFEERRTKNEYSKLLGRELEFKDFSGTFLICIAIPVIVEDHKELFAVSCQIGDGIICSVDRNADFDKALRILGQPDSGKYSGETDFLTSESMKRKETLMTKTKIMRSRTSAIMLMTDGVADDYFPNMPELLRLYLDLELNGVLDIPEQDENSEEKAYTIASPVSYPWVNDNEQLVAVQYASSVAESAGITTEQLWNDKNLIRKASLESFKTELPETRKDRLLRWLDNYTQRGSFDDRTLLICELTEK